ncbi:hypothetical protein A3C23_05485 [Candidatus Roizmanbacteria bacterium RIFCSPHIGHO2_02_FULL_37_13b]|uniref:Plasmid stabilization protein n=1 Tax=Candidatus Roizmanbacteria bacterium RIFCSPLOWO2_02_FULL_36_11 TaxID=1802071 RepID=A0A1F7JCJ6_9BACT|nr:MAG: hypothetical protein A3C23_05485 [Candidatus Roizmanbacteria bacterium RIFCSPHIGHO2_02_FULL_37_13b]OGK53305.1 MAG: hypothetical protein A3H78_03305 [Candidatus Roizmanbacteria bacterium RIFCSPLOWO2_02_FULL_36_11]
MRIILSPQAEKSLRHLTKIDQIAIAQKIRSLRDSNIHLNEEKLKGYRDVFRIRVGDYRIVYRQQKQIVYIILISHRKDIYRILRQMMS